jgi:hypothetical protein
MMQVLQAEDHSRNRPVVVVVIEGCHHKSSTKTKMIKNNKEFRVLEALTTTELTLLMLDTSTRSIIMVVAVEPHLVISMTTITTTMKIYYRVVTRSIVATEIPLVRSKTTTTSPVVKRYYGVAIHINSIVQEAEQGHEILILLTVIEKRNGVSTTILVQVAGEHHEISIMTVMPC